MQKQWLEPQPGVFRLLALVQTTRPTDGYDYFMKFHKYKLTKRILFGTI